MIDFDFIIVGSGAAGGAAAWELCRQGFKVVCLERGPEMDPSTYPSTKSDWEVLKQTQANPVIAERQNEFDYPVDDSESPIAMCNYNAVGGSTILYSGHFPRFRPQDFSLKTSENISKDWPISYSDLKPWFEINEHQMSVSGLEGDPYYPDVKNLLPPVPLGQTGTLLAEAFNKKNWHWWPSYSAISTVNSRGRPTCLNLGPCNTGCPQGAKSSTDNTYIPRAKALGLKMMPTAAVSKVLVEDGRAAGVIWYDREARPHNMRAKHGVILAASAIGTPRLLLNSSTEDHPNGLANRSDQLGRNLMIHPLGYVEGLFSQALDTHIGPQGCMLYSLEHYRTPKADHKLGYMMHALRGSGPMETALSIFQRRKLKFGCDLYKNFEELYNKKIVISIICEDFPELKNRIMLDPQHKDHTGTPGVKVHYKLHNNTKKMMSHGMGKARELMIEAGAKRSYASGPVRNSGWHIMGTACMGEDPSTSVVDPMGQAHDVPGLYVVDSSVFVTGSCVNPANTIQSVALYLSNKIGQKVKYES